MMKKFTLIRVLHTLSTLVLCLIVLPICTAQAWEPKDPDMPGSLWGESVFAIDESIAWTYGYEADAFNQYTFLNSGISKTSNGGDTWTSVKFPILTRFYTTSMWALDNQIAWLTGVSQEPGVDSVNYLFKTVDGGQVWSRIPVPVEVFINFVYMWNENDGMIMGDPDALGFEIYTTNDGGESWTRSNNVPSALPGEFAWKDNYAVIGNELWYSTDRGRIYHTSDKGDTWEVLDAPPTTRLALQMDVSTGRDIYLTFSEYDASVNLDSFTVYRRNAGNGEWDNISGENNDFFLYDIQTIPFTNTVLLSLEAQLPQTRISYDRGTTWVTIDESYRINAMDFYNASSGYATEPNLGMDFYETKIYVFTGSATSTKNSILSDVEINISPNPITDVVNIKVISDQSEDFKLSVNSITGEIIHERKFIQTSVVDYKFNMAACPPGTYIITLSNKKGALSEKVVKIY